MEISRVKYPVFSIAGNKNEKDPLKKQSLENCCAQSMKLSETLAAKYYFTHIYTFQGLQKTTEAY